MIKYNYQYYINFICEKCSKSGIIGFNSDNEILNIKCPFCCSVELNIEILKHNDIIKKKLVKVIDNESKYFQSIGVVSGIGTKFVNIRMPDDNIETIMIDLVQRIKT